MNLDYCHNDCPIGKAASDLFLDMNNSAFDAAFDFRHFVENCLKSCPYKDMHLHRIEEA